MRYTRQQHLRTAADFTEIRASGKRWKCGFFYAHFLETAVTTSGPLRRLGVIASRRTGQAVDRNRAKRLLREVFRNNQGQLPETCDLLMVARSTLPAAGYGEVERKFTRMVQSLVRENKP